MHGIQCAENQHAHFSSALGLLREKEAIYHVHVFLYLLLDLYSITVNSFLCHSVLNTWQKLLKRRKVLSGSQLQRITLCHNRRGVGRKTLSVSEDREHDGRELGDSKGLEQQSTGPRDLLPPPRPSLLKAQQHPKR